MLTIQLPKELEDRLENLSTKTDRSKTYYMIKALETFLEGQEDFLLMLGALANGDGLKYSLDEIMERCGVEKSDYTPIEWASMTPQNTVTDPKSDA